MDPTTITLLITSVAGPILVALAHRMFPGAFGLQSASSTPATPSQPVTPNPAAPTTPLLGRRQHPLLQRLLGSGTGQGFLSELLQAAENAAAIPPTTPATPPQADATSAALAAVLSSIEKRLLALETPVPPPTATGKVASNE
jgi:hypothetical protein